MDYALVSASAWEVPELWVLIIIGVLVVAIGALAQIEGFTTGCFGMGGVIIAAGFIIAFTSDGGVSSSKSADALVVSIEDAYDLEVSSDTARSLLFPDGSSALVASVADATANEVIELGSTQLLVDGERIEVSLAYAGGEWMLVDAEGVEVSQDGGSWQ